ncbi:response regulator [Halocola ammonii]
MQFVKNVFLIDDNPSCNFIMTEFIKLADESINVFTAESVSEAISALEAMGEETFPDVLYVDLNMPVQSGFEFIEEYEEKFYSKHPNSRLFMLTSSLREEDKLAAMDYNSVEGFVSKNDIDEFLQNTLLKKDLS